MKDRLKLKSYLLFFSNVEIKTEFCKKSNLVTEHEMKNFVSNLFKLHRGNSVGSLNTLNLFSFETSLKGMLS